MNASTPSVETILAQAVEIAEPEERQSFVAQACGGDAALQRQVECLIANHFQAGSFLEQPAVAIDPQGTAGWEAARSADAVGTVIGPYKLLEQIGEGGMGLVFVAEQHQPIKRRVALKIIKPGMDSRQVIARFEAERQALALMDHPNIAKVHDGGATPQGRPYFVMELVKGTPITDFCDQHRLTTRQRLELFLDVCHAVQHAHQKGIIHRDLKPSNVLVEVHDVHPVVKVIDFGIAKAMGQQLTDKTVYTAVTQMVGTPLYMSPEQAGLSSMDVDTRSDVYSLGVLLYELLTGTTPFDSEALKKGSYDEMRRIIREDEPPRPSTRLSTMQQAHLSTIAERRGLEPRRLSQQLRGELDWIVMKALEKDRNRRYETVSAFAADVQHYLHDEPVAASPPSSVYRLRKFAKRNRNRLAVAALLLAAGLLVVSILGVVHVQNAGRLRQLTQDVQQFLAEARTAIEADNLALARQRLAEAQGRLGTERDELKDQAAEVDRVQQEVNEREADAARFHRFRKLVDEVENGELTTNYPDHAARISKAEEALGVYGALTDEDWVASLDSTYLTTSQKQEVRESAYVVLLYLADYRLRWLANDPKEEAAARGLALLGRAAAFHEPTRAFYFVRSECHRQQGSAPAAEEDAQHYKQMAGKTAWDYFLPGRTAAWRGDLEEAQRSYLAALRMQPNHFQSLFFLADHVMSNPKINRLPEAVQLFTACIALRPDHESSYLNREQCFMKLGQLEEAEADLAELVKLMSERLRRQKAQLGPDSEYTLQSMNTLAVAHFELGRLQDVIALLEPTLEKWRAALGPDHKGVLQSMNNLGAAYLEAGRLQDAIALLKPALKQLKATLGPDHEDTLAGMNNLARAYQGLGRLQEAIPLLEQALEKRKATLGPDHKDTLMSMTSLGAAYLAAGQLQDAIALHELALKKRKATLGSDHKDTLQSMGHLAQAYLDAGRAQDAIALLEPMLEKQKAKLGSDHKDTLISMNNLAAAYHRLGRFHEAIALLEQTLAKLKAKLGPDHKDTLQSMHNLGVVYLDMGRPQHAIPLFEQTLEKRKSTLGPEHEDTLHIMRDLTSAYQNTGKLDQANRLLRDLLQHQRKKDGPMSAKTAGMLAMLGMNLLKQQQYVAAEPILRECLAIREQKLPDDWLRYNTLSMLGESLLGQKKYAAAEAFLLQGYEGIKQREAKIPSQGKTRLTEAAERLVRLYEAMNQPEEARMWRAKLPSGKRPGS